MIRLVCLDVDGTLVNEKKEIPPLVLHTLQRIQERGVKVTLASGRLISSLREYADLIGTQAPLIALNGAWVEKIGETPILCIPLETHTACQLIDKAEQDGLHVSVYFADGVMLKNDDSAQDWPYFHQKLENLQAEVVEYWPFTQKNSRSNDLQPINCGSRPLMKVLVSGKLETISKFILKYEEEFHSQCHFFLSNDQHLEIVSPQVSKGEALHVVAAYLGIKQEEVLAIGDHYNDLSMLEFAGLGVAMGNAPQPVQARANWVTKSNTEMGVAVAIAHFFGEWVLR